MEARPQLAGAHPNVPPPFSSILFTMRATRHPMRWLRPVRLSTLSMLHEVTVAINPVFRQNTPPTETQYHNALVAGLSRVAMTTGRGALADKSQRTTRALEKLFAGEVQDTSGKGLLDFTLADPSALDEVLSLYGTCLKHKMSDAANDMELAAGLGHCLSELIDRLRDGNRCHLDTLALAEMFRREIPRMQAIVDEADRIRGAA